MNRARSANVSIGHAYPAAPRILTALDASSWLQWCREAAKARYEGSLCQSGNVEPSGGGSEVHRLQEAPRLYVGLDIHDQRIAISVLGETGQIVRRAQVRTIDEMMRILEALPDRFEVCYEASCGYGHYHDLLRRAPTPREARFWTHVLDRGVSPRWVAATIANSPEGLAAVVQSEYRLLLGRSATPDDVAAQVKTLRRTKSTNGLILSLVTSPKFLGLL
jgi:hypothetical protein